ncbi:transporter substrate-binding domain-containing protein [Thalassomonas viridans]|uniref:Transporter substrate-binding domain-containing protein n=1 Tax=Thalassomonas viridans TaxID=137584 RepID=A0AAF0CAM6_9GAMM|nr:transporter substrate-binding domain-containing protein [Thalassomonas viridans]WDE07018.1 transporter substrate-binding domain-containing protein [Thalassomonas viridans]
MRLIYRKITKIQKLVLVCTLLAYPPIPQAAEINIVTEPWPPNIYINEAGVISGPLTEKIIAIMASAKLSYSLNMYPWPRAYNYALSDKNVLIYPIFKTPERETLFHFICPLTKKVDLFFVKLASRRDIRINTLADAKKYRIGLIRDDYDHALLLQHGFKDGLQLDANTDDLSTLRKLIKGRIDLMMQSKKSLYDNLSSQKLDKSEIEFAYQLKDEHIAQNCIALSKQTPLSLVEQIRQAMNKINDAGPLIDINE